MIEQLQTGAVLMAVGMGTVYVLLAALVLVVHAVSKISRKLERPSAAAAVQPRRIETAVDDDIVGVISAAVQMHRDRQAGKRR